MGQKQRATIYPHATDWQAVRRDAVDDHLTASAIVAQLVADYVQWGPDDKAALRARARETFHRSPH